VGGENKKGGFLPSTGKKERFLNDDKGQNRQPPMKQFTGKEETRKGAGEGINVVEQ